MIAFEKSSPGSATCKNLKWLPEMAFQGFYISKISGAACQIPPETHISSTCFACLPPHKFLVTAMKYTQYDGSLPKWPTNLRGNFCINPIVHTNGPLHMWWAKYGLHYMYEASAVKVGQTLLLYVHSTARPIISRGQLSKAKIKWKIITRKTKSFHPMQTPKTVPWLWRVRG